MKVTFDTNVVLDVYLNRAPFAAGSSLALKLSESGKISGSITANTVTDIYYILGRHIKEISLLKQLVLKLLTAVEVTDVLGKDITKAFALPMVDFEDALAAQCASRAKSAYIVTRNERDFEGSPVPAISPEDFLSRFFPDQHPK
jgi:predicted nucleic acid-binding protein